jgi:hypothetical protein
MAKTADVQQAIWSDPWFLALPPDGKLLYFWAITNEHANLAGLFTVAEQMIQFETKLSPARFTKALALCEGKLYYRRESGVMWVVGRANNVRSRTTQIAKSIVRAVETCPEPDLQAAFVAKYAKQKWLMEAFDDLALGVDSVEPHLNLSELHGQSHSLNKDCSSSIRSTEELSSEGNCERVFQAWVDSRGSGGRAPVLDRERRALIERWLKVYPVEDLEAAVRGWRHSPHHRGENESGKKYNSLKLCLRDPDRIEEFRDLELSPELRPRSSKAAPGMAQAERRAAAIRAKQERAAA